MNPYIYIYIIASSETGTKSATTIRDARIMYKGGKPHYMVGFVTDHPKLRDGAIIATSSIVAVKGNVVETLNTIYTVETWADKPTEVLCHDA